MPFYFKYLHNLVDGEKKDKIIVKAKTQEKAEKKIESIKNGILDEAKQCEGLDVLTMTDVPSGILYGPYNSYEEAEEEAGYNDEEEVE